MLDIEFLFGDDFFKFLHRLLIWTGFRDNKYNGYEECDGPEENKVEYIFQIPASFDIDGSNGGAGRYACFRHPIVSSIAIS